MVCLKGEPGNASDKEKSCDFQRTKHCYYVNKIPDCCCLVFAVCMSVVNTCLASEAPLFSRIKWNRFVTATKFKHSVL